MKAGLGWARLGQAGVDSGDGGGGDDDDDDDDVVYAGRGKGNERLWLFLDRICDRTP